MAKQRAVINWHHYLLLPLIFLLLCQSLMAVERGRYPRYYFSLSYTQGEIGIGDLNTYLTSFNNNEVFSYIRENNPTWGEVAGEIFPLSGSYKAWEMKLFVEINSRFTVGVSTHSPYGKKKVNTITYKYHGSLWTQVHAYTIYSGYTNYSPLELNIYYKLWGNDKFGLSFGLVSGFYRASITRHINLDLANPTGQGSTRRILESERPYLPALCGSANILAEYSISPKLSLLAEIRRRYGRVKNFEGTELWSYGDENGNLAYEEHKGKLWYYINDDTWTGARYGQLEISDTKPEGGWLGIPEDVRKAGLDLGGFSFSLGLKIRLF